MGADHCIRSANVEDNAADVLTMSYSLGCDAERLGRVHSWG